MAQINYQMAQGTEANIDLKLIERMQGLSTDTKRINVIDNDLNNYRFPSEERIADLSVNFAFDVGYQGSIPANNVGDALESLSSAIGLSGSGISFVNIGDFDFVASQYDAFKVDADNFIAEGKSSILEIVLTENSSGTVQAVGHIMVGSNNSGGAQSWVLDWSYNNIAHEYGGTGWQFWTGQGGPSTFQFGITTGTNFTDYNLSIATIGALPIGINGLDQNVTPLGQELTALFDITKNTGGGGSLPSDFIICTTSQEVLDAWALAEEVKTIFIHDGAQNVSPTSDTPILVYGKNLVLGSADLLIVSSFDQFSTLKFQSVGPTAVLNVNRMLTGFASGSPPSDLIEVNGVSIHCDIFTTPAEYVINGTGYIGWSRFLGVAPPIAGTGSTGQDFINNWGLKNTYSASNKIELIDILKLKAPRKIINVTAEVFNFDDAEIVNDIYGINEIYGPNTGIDIQTPIIGSILLAGDLSNPTNEINFHNSFFSVGSGVSDIILDSITVKTKNFTSGIVNKIGLGIFIYENAGSIPQITGATQQIWDNSQIFLGNNGTFQVTGAGGRATPTDGLASGLIMDFDNTQAGLLYIGGAVRVTDPLFLNTDIFIENSTGGVDFDGLGRIRGDGSDVLFTDGNFKFAGTSEFNNTIEINSLASGPAVKALGLNASNEVCEDTGGVGGGGFFSEKFCYPGSPAQFSPVNYGNTVGNGGITTYADLQPANVGYGSYLNYIAVMMSRGKTGVSLKNVRVHVRIFNETQDGPLSSYITDLSLPNAANWKTLYDQVQVWPANNGASRPYDTIDNILVGQPTVGSLDVGWLPTDTYLAITQITLTDTGSWSASPEGITVTTDWSF